MRFAGLVAAVLAEQIEADGAGEPAPEGAGGRAGGGGPLREDFGAGELDPGRLEDVEEFLPALFELILLEIAVGGVVGAVGVELDDLLGEGGVVAGEGDEAAAAVGLGAGAVPVHFHEDIDAGGELAGAAGGQAGGCGHLAGVMEQEDRRAGLGELGEWGQRVGEDVGVDLGVGGEEVADGVDDDEVERRGVVEGGEIVGELEPLSEGGLAAVEGGGRRRWRGP